MSHIWFPYGWLNQCFGQSAQVPKKIVPINRQIRCISMYPCGLICTFQLQFLTNLSWLMNIKILFPLTCSITDIYFMKEFFLTLWTIRSSYPYRMDYVVFDIITEFAPLIMQDIMMLRNKVLLLIINLQFLSMTWMKE